MRATLQNGACVNKCFDSNQLKFHNIDFITKTSDNTYKIEVWTNGIHYWFFTYQGTGHGLVLSVIDDGGAPDLLEVPYGRFTNVLNIQRWEGIKNKDYSYKIKLMKQWCPEEIIFNVHQYKLHRCKLDGSPSFSVVYTDNVKHYWNVDVLKSMNRNGEVCFSDNHFGCLWLKDWGSTYDWIFNRVDLESSFLKNYLTENSYDPWYGSINFDFPIWKIHWLSSGDLEGCNLLNKSIKHTYGSPISHEAYGEIGWRIDEVWNVYIVWNWYPWKSPDKLSRKWNYVYLDGKEYWD